MRGYGYLLLALASGAAAAQTSAPVNARLSKGASAPQSGKPAEVFYLSENGDGSYAINAALTGYKRLDFIDTAYAEHELLFGGAISKTDLKAAPTDLRSANLGLATEWTGLNWTRLELHSALTYAAEENRVKRSRGHAARIDVSLIALCPAPNFDTGESGVFFECYPYGGYLHRKISSTDDPPAAPLGSHAGPYAGFFLRASFGKVTDSAWWAPVSIELDTYRLKETHVSGAYTRQRYDYSTATLSYALHGGGNSRWKPRISLVREIGADRLSSKDKVASTKLALQLGYGL